jgi:hypothetical protein
LLSFEAIGCAEIDSCWVGQVGFYPASFVELIDERSVTTEERIYDDPDVKNAMIETADNLPISGRWQAEQQQSVARRTGSGSGEDGEQWVHVSKD